MSKSPAPWEFLRGYIRAASDYAHTKKGAHDIRDYARAAGLIALTCAVALLLAEQLF